MTKRDNHMGFAAQVPNSTGGLDLRPYDVAGQVTGAIRLADSQEMTYWERKLDAMVMLTWTKKIFNDAEMRALVEETPPDDYARLTYYERWSLAILRGIERKGILSPSDLDDVRATAALKRRQALGP
jgi:hypothetical protein